MHMTDFGFDSHLKRRKECRSDTQTLYLLLFLFSLYQENFNLQTLLLQVTILNTFPKGPMNEVTFEVQF